MTDSQNSLEETIDNLSLNNDKSMHYTHMKETLDTSEVGNDNEISSQKDAYIRNLESKATRYKYYFLICLFLLVLLAASTFLSRFDIKGQYVSNVDKELPQETTELDDKGRKKSTGGGVKKIRVADFWDDYLQISSHMVTTHRSNYGGKNVNYEIETIEIAKGIITLYGYNGSVWFEYYPEGASYQANDTNKTAKVNWIMYKRDDNDEVNTLTAHRRRLPGPKHPPTTPNDGQNDNDCGRRRLQGPKHPPTTPNDDQNDDDCGRRRLQGPGRQPTIQKNSGNGGSRRRLPGSKHPPSTGNPPSNDNNGGRRRIQGPKHPPTTPNDGNNGGAGTCSCCNEC